MKTFQWAFIFSKYSHSYAGHKLHSLVPQKRLEESVTFQCWTENGFDVGKGSGDGGGEVEDRQKGEKKDLARPRVSQLFVLRRKRELAVIGSQLW